MDKVEGLFNRAAEAVEKLSPKEIEEVFQYEGVMDVVSAFKRGAILNHAKNAGFPDDEAGFVDWIRNTLSISLSDARRFLRVYLWVSRDGLCEGDIRGVSMYSLITMLRILEAEK